MAAHSNKRKVLIIIIITRPEVDKVKPKVWFKFKAHKILVSAQSPLVLGFWVYMFWG